ncbi:hypothetical protein [Microbacterium sp. MMO-56]|uniref:hypothetical protein n=1 Tax=Microbacterium sp. MMO-56 TaxID=3081281 RepID=UPI0030199154
MSTLLDEIETYGTTCWEPLCEWEAPERFTRSEAMADADAHRDGAHPWEYAWNSGSTREQIGDRRAADAWCMERFGCRAGEGDWGSRVERRRLPHGVWGPVS